MATVDGVIVELLTFVGTVGLTGVVIVGRGVVGTTVRAAVEFERLTVVVGRFTVVLLRTAESLVVVGFLFVTAGLFVFVVLLFVGALYTLVSIPVFGLLTGR